MYGDVYNSEGAKVRHLFGAWNEAMFCGKEEERSECIWKVGELSCLKVGLEGAHCVWRRERERGGGGGFIV